MFHVEQNRNKMDKEGVKGIIRDVPDFPKKGILFKDVTPLFQDAEAWAHVVEVFYERFKGKGITKIVGVESRGFLLGPALALKLGVGFIPIRKPGKLPWKKYTESYDLEYGSETVEIHQDALDENDLVVIHDDLLATGGTMGAAINLVRKCNAKVFETSFIVELDFLKGREKLEQKDVDVYSYIHY